MTTAPIRRDTEEWLEYRRSFITSTAIPVILGLSPYRCEADLAAEMRGEWSETPDPKRERMFRLGHSLEAIIREEDQFEHGIAIRRVNRFIVSRLIPWAATSLDFERVGQRCIVEAKASRSRRWDDGLPQDVEAQVRWQMGVARYPHAHVALLRAGSELECFDVDHNEATFGGLVDIAADFLTRYRAGGPFAENAESVKRRYPSDNGAEMVADADLNAAVAKLSELRTQRRDIEGVEEDIETAIKKRMGEFAVLSGAGYRVTWKRTKDRAETDWRAVADEMLTTLPETERAALVGRNTAVRQGFRPFRVVFEKES